MTERKEEMKERREGIRERENRGRETKTVWTLRVILLIDLYSRTNYKVQRI